MARESDEQFSENCRREKRVRTLDAYVNVVGGLGFFTSVLVGFGEGVCDDETLAK